MALTTSGCVPLESERVSAAVMKMLLGEDDQDGKTLAMPLQSFMRKYVAAHGGLGAMADEKAVAEAVAGTLEVQEMMSVVQREITENRLERLQPLLNELPVDAFDPGLPSLVSLTCRWLLSSRVECPFPIAPH